MPGIDLNLDLPTLADPLVDVVSKLTTAISTIEDDLADQITSGEIDINATLSANGQALINVGGLQLAGGVSTTTGTLYTDGQDLFYRSAAGTVQITAAGAIDVASLGTIGGDYGAGTALVTYDLASQEYRFFHDPANTYADLVADDMVVMTSFGGGSVRIGSDPTITTARSFIFKDLPTAGISCLVYDATTSTVEDAQTSRITNDVKVTTLNASGNVTANDSKHVIERVRKLHPAQGWVSTGTVTKTASLYGLVQFTVIGDGIYSIPAGLSSGDRAKIVHMRLNKSSGGDITVEVWRVGYLETGTLIQSFTYSTAGIGNITCTITTPVTLADGEDIVVVVTCAAVGDQIRNGAVWFDRP